MANKGLGLKDHLLNKFLSKDALANNLVEILVPLAMELYENEEKRKEIEEFLKREKSPIFLIPQKMAILGEAYRIYKSRSLNPLSKDYESSFFEWLRKHKFYADRAIYLIEAGERYWEFVFGKTEENLAKEGNLLGELSPLTGIGMAWFEEEWINVGEKGERLLVPFGIYLPNRSLGIFNRYVDFWGGGRWDQDILDPKGKELKMKEKDKLFAIEWAKKHWKEYLNGEKDALYPEVLWYYLGQKLYKAYLVANVLYAFVEAWEKVKRYKERERKLAEKLKSEEAKVLLSVLTELQVKVSMFADFLGDAVASLEERVMTENQRNYEHLKDAILKTLREVKEGNELTTKYLKTLLRELDKLEGVKKLLDKIDFELQDVKYNTEEARLTINDIYAIQNAKESFRF